MIDHSKKAAEFFLGGFNCAQSVAMAFADVVGMEEKTLARLASGFGGGMGRLREVCGAFSGMVMVFGWLYGYDDPKADEEKGRLYADLQTIAAEFKKEEGTIICRELLDNPPSDPKPSVRTAAYYAERPCVRFVALAACLLDEYIAAHPLA